MALPPRRTRQQQQQSQQEDGIPLVDFPYAIRSPAARRPVAGGSTSWAGPAQPSARPQQQQQQQHGHRTEDGYLEPRLAEASTASGSTSSGTRKGSLGGESSVKEPGRSSPLGTLGQAGAADDAASTLPLPVLNSSSASAQTARSVRSSSPRPALSSNPAVRAVQRVSRFLGGPTPPQALPRIGDSLSLAITVPRYGRFSLSPDAWFARTYLARFRRAFPPASYRHGTLLLVFFAAWIVGFAFLVKANSFESTTVPSDGTAVQFLGCTDTFATANDGCGLEFTDCAASGNLTFRCPAGCASQLIYNTVAVGNLRPDLVPFVIGGGQSDGETRVYRADSFICSAYVHSGLVTDARGGCGVVNLQQNISAFPASLANGIQSLAFPTAYPLAFSFESVGSAHCEDLRWEILGFNVAMGCILSLLLDPGPLVFLWTLICVSYWHVILVSDPRAYPPVISDAFQDFLPTLLAGYFFWRVACRFTLPSFASHALERTLWFFAPFWCGVLLNIVSDKIQIDRLGGSDITGKTVGTFTALVIVIVILAAWQISVAWRTGWLPFYLRWTVAGGLVILVLSQLPDLTFRLHHYVFALLFVPALGFATRVSAVLQGLLIGIFANGIGKYGWESILETADELRRDAALGSALPVLRTNTSTWGNYTGGLFNQAALLWEPVPVELEAEWNGFSLLVDDVERYTGTATNYSLAAFDDSLPHFFRLAYQLDGTSGDYIKAATWWPNGTWVDPAEGPS